MTIKGVICFSVVRVRKTRRLRVKDNLIARSTVQQTTVPCNIVVFVHAKALESIEYTYFFNKFYVSVKHSKISFLFS